MRHLFLFVWLQFFQDIIFCPVREKENTADNKTGYFKGRFFGCFYDQIDPCKAQEKIREPHGDKGVDLPFITKPFTHCEKDIVEENNNHAYGNTP